MPGSDAASEHTARLHAALKSAGLTQVALDTQLEGLQAGAIADGRLTVRVSAAEFAHICTHYGAQLAAAAATLGAPDGVHITSDTRSRHITPNGRSTPSAPPSQPSLWSPQTIEQDRARLNVERPYRATRAGRVGARGRLDALDTHRVPTALIGHMPVDTNPHARHSPESPLSYAGVAGHGHATFTPTRLHLRVAWAMSFLWETATIRDGHILASWTLLSRAVYGHAAMRSQMRELRNAVYDLVAGEIAYRSTKGERHNMPSSPLAGALCLDAQGELVSITDAWQPDATDRSHGRWLRGMADSGCDENLALIPADWWRAAMTADDSERGRLFTLASRRLFLACGRAIVSYARTAAMAPRPDQPNVKQLDLAINWRRELGRHARCGAAQTQRELVEDLQAVCDRNAHVAALEQTINQYGYVRVRITEHADLDAAPAAAAIVAPVPPRCERRRRRANRAKTRQAPRRGHAPRGSRAQRQQAGRLRHAISARAQPEPH